MAGRLLGNGTPGDIGNRAKTIFVEPISNIHLTKNFGGPLDLHQSRCWLLNQGFLQAELAEGTSCIREVFPPIFAKIGEVQRNLDSSENPICSRVWATYTYTKNLKKRIDYLVYKMIILYLRYITTYGCSRI